MFNSCGLESPEISRYSRQLILEEWGVQSQIKAKSSKVLIVGAGGLGAPLVLYLAGAGIGTIGIVDGDQVDISNLHRQVILLCGT
jgi:adenylyltransferase/sulfurtransferase